MNEFANEPTNAQLARFIVIYGNTHPLLANLDVNPYFLERIFETDENARQRCLKIHRDFQTKADELGHKIARGEMQCEHIRANGKRCPNYNEPGRLFCGLHQESEDADRIPDTGHSHAE
jgi:hypothetical protein